MVFPPMFWVSAIFYVFYLVCLSSPRKTTYPSKRVPNPQGKSSLKGLLNNPALSALGGGGTKAAVMGVGVPYLGPFGRLGF